MLQFEHERTEEIVTKLVKIGRSIRFFILLGSLLFWGALFLLAGSTFNLELCWPFGLIGLAVGFLLGSFLASTAVVGLEWMAQLLVAKGELLASLKKK